MIIIGSRLVHFGNIADIKLDCYVSGNFQQPPIRNLRQTNSFRNQGLLYRRKSLAPDSPLRKGRESHF
jgi:hypothetical protein